MPSLLIPLRGAWHRPPAQALLRAAKANAALVLLREPENAYDSNAIAAWLPAGEFVSQEKLEEELAKSGWDTDRLMDLWHEGPEPIGSPAWQVGYMAKEFAASAVANRWPLADASLAWNADGKPAIRLQMERMP
jgi:hypothetical protein